MFAGLFILDWYWIQNNYYPSAEKINKLTLKAEQGDAEAFKLLTRHYRVIEQNISKKIDFFRKHQDREYRFKSFLAQTLLENENDIDISEGIEILKNLAKKHDRWAQSHLIYIYTKGWIVEKNITQALYWAKIVGCGKNEVSSYSSYIDILAENFNDDKEAMKLTLAMLIYTKHVSEHYYQNSRYGELEIKIASNLNQQDVDYITENYDDILYEYCQIIYEELTQ